MAIPLKNQANFAFILLPYNIIQLVNIFFMAQFRSAFMVAAVPQATQIAMHVLSRFHLLDCNNSGHHAVSSANCAFISISGANTR